MDSITTVPLTLPNNTRIRVEATPVKRSGDSDVSFEAIKEALAIDNIQGAIEGIAQTVLSGLRTVAPDKAAVEFGLEIGLERSSPSRFSSMRFNWRSNLTASASERVLSCLSDRVRNVLLESGTRYHYNWLDGKRLPFRLKD